MTPEELDDFTTRYFRDWTFLLAGSRTERVAHEHDPELPSYTLDQMLYDGEDAEMAWPILVALIDRAPDDEALAFVAAGPLEHLVRRHGDRFADRLINQAQGDARFREALGGVWGWEDVPEPLRGRLLGLIRTAN